MLEQRVNDGQAKRLRAKVRSWQDPCHICGKDINYQAHHHQPDAFQVDHLWQVALGGPEHDIENLGASHRACNRKRSNKIDAITIAAAASYGVTLTAPGAPPARPCGTPDDQHCTACNGTHPSTPGVEFVTARNWWSK